MVWFVNPFALFNGYRYIDLLCAIVCRCKKLPKGMKDWQAFLDLKKKIDDFNETCPMLEMMTQKSMKERHWKRISKVTGFPFDVESDSFRLRNIMEAPLLQFKDDIEVAVLRLVSLSPSPSSVHMQPSMVILSMSWQYLKHQN